MKNKLLLFQYPVKKYINAIIFILLGIMQLIIITQMIISNHLQWLTLWVTVCCLLLDAFVALNTYATMDEQARMVLFSFEFIILLSICIMTGNNYLYILFCLILTQFYLSKFEFKTKLIMAIIVSVLYIISYVIGWVKYNPNAEIRFAIVSIFGDLIQGLIITIVHFICVNFIINYIEMTNKLKTALKNEEESKLALVQAYEQLHEAALLEQRNSIAKDIHDNTGHSMTNIIMQTEAAKVIIDTDPDKAKKLIISANQQAKIALDQMRESVHLLAGRNASMSIKAEVDGILAQTMDGTGVRIMFDTDDFAVEDEVRRFICNSIKELLTNGMRHGKATAFYVSMKDEKKRYRIIVSDNGCGVGKDFKEGFGLTNMREKLELLNGRISYSSTDGEGFEVQIIIPKEEKDND